VPPGLTSPFHLGIILVVALVVLGPEQLPGALRKAARLMAEIRRWSEDMKAQMDDAVSFDAPPSAPPWTARTPSAEAPPVQAARVSPDEAMGPDRR